MSRRERVQMPLHVGVAPPPDEPVCGKPAEVRRAVLQGVSKRVHKGSVTTRAHRAAKRPRTTVSSLSPSRVPRTVSCLPPLSRSHQTKRVLANQVYQEFIQDRHHLHMNSTKWETLTDFVKWMGRERVCEVDETPRGWFVAWIDRSPKALERAAAEARRARQDADDEAREKRLLEEQVQRATETRAAATAATESPEVRVGVLGRGFSEFCAEPRGTGNCANGRV
ncbi:MAG: domain of Kin17 curved DNA-binding protein-domain-containing protein [Olpidium bornovanus]|uniref:Domain of Kin17 curved DNA-binding protein-domain-containing protein n=1 Tax=Olpidium bornovanus TaxID=278681 RepID=A0A8H8A0Z6_9FUNG|nr:MAG: domain of Kin17 curved DNA-binding protein-domain-containing protein [Olpidium bornovanus]